MRPDRCSYVCQGVWELIPISAVMGGVAGAFLVLDGTVRSGAAGLRTLGMGRSGVEGRLL
jgi:hypothetical protein